MIICIVGPTASGKSDLALKIADFYEAKIVNFDAFQIYKEMNIGTAKPSKEELESGKYFLYDMIDINENFDVSKYQKLGREFINNHKNENLIFVGGTGLYLKALLYDYKFEKEEPMPSDYLSDQTNEELFNKLSLIDKEDAIKIGKNNRKRLMRALYIFKIHGKTKSDLNSNGKEKLLYDDVYFIGLDIPREALYEKINKRVDEMISFGLEKEATDLFLEYGNDKRALQAIGYKEFNNNELSLEEKIDLIKKNTRNYAKRQMTFFKHQFSDIKWFNSINEALEYGKNIRCKN